MAIKTTGNVFTYEAVEQLNIKGKNWKDLLDDTPFTKNDIIVIQEPNKLAKFNIASFHHVKNSLKVETEGNINHSTNIVHPIILTGILSIAG